MTGTSFSVTEAMRPYAAQEDERRDQRAGNADHDRRDAECGLERRADRVGLHHIAGEAERKDNREREKAREELAEFARKARADVVDRAARDVTILIRGLVFLGEYGLAVDGGHAEERGNPHPEDGARAARIERGGCARDVARADLGRDRGGECLERAHAVLARLFAAEREAAEQALCSPRRTCATCTKRVRIVKIMPVPTSRYSSTLSTRCR